MTWGVAWVILKSWGPKLLGFLPAVPRQVWLALAALLFLSYFAHWNAERGRAEVEARIAAEVAAERLRIEAADDAAIEAADERAIAAERLAALRERELRDVIEDASHMDGAGNVCVPGTLADRLRDL